MDVGLEPDEVLGERFCPLSNTSQASRPVDVLFRIRSSVRPAFICLMHSLAVVGRDCMARMVLCSFEVC